MHGTYAPEGVLEGLILIDGERLDPMVVKGCAFTRAPFVFLNACQVGSGNEVLGDYSGMAEAFLHAGAAAVIAPLWSIDDTAAKELALRFYQRVFDDGVTPASVLREERSAYAGPGGDGAATRLAYQYFGHPGLVTARALGRGAPHGDDSIKGAALHIGLNHVDPDHYQGWDGELAGCQNDARDLQAIADGRRVRHDAAPRRAGVGGSRCKAAITKAAERARGR